MRKIALAAVAFAALLGGRAFADTVILQDNFDSDAPPVLNWPGDSKFTSTSPPGSIDLIGAPPQFFDLQPGHGYYVDLDGTTGSNNDPAGQLTSVLSFGPGAYKLTFDLAGNLRNAPSETTTVNLGDFTTSLTPANTDPFVTHTITFSTAASGHLVFTDLGPSNQQGNLLDNITLASVPEPATWAMMIMGLAGVGAALRNRRKDQASAITA
jgi:hypothetical protein